MTEVMVHTDKTPIEVMLQVDEDGRTSARKVYKFLGLADGQFSRWAKTNIIDNKFATNREDYVGFDINVEGNETKDYKLTTAFAKKLCMTSQSTRGEQARDYFIRVEQTLKEVALKTKQPSTDKNKRLEIMEMNARTRQANLLYKMSGVDTLSTEYKNILVSKATEVLSGEPLLPLPKSEQKTYSATELGKMFGVSSQKVGIIAKVNNLKIPEYGEWYRDKSRYSNKEVDSFRYFDTVIPKIEELTGIRAKIAS